MIAGSVTLGFLVTGLAVLSMTAFMILEQKRERDEELIRKYCPASAEVLEKVEVYKPKKSLRKFLRGEDPEMNEEELFFAGRYWHGLRLKCNMTNGKTKEILFEVSHENYDHVCVGMTISINREWIIR